MLVRRGLRKILLVAIVMWCATVMTVPVLIGQTNGSFVPVTDSMLENPAPSDWLMWRRTPNGWGYSPLDQIKRANVSKLKLVWTRALATGSQQGTPLADGGTLYMPNPNDHIQAINAVTGDLGNTIEKSPLMRPMSLEDRPWCP